MKLINTLIAQSEQLADGRYEGKNGVACRLIVGMKGIGKTTLLNTFATTVCPILFPTIIPVYITCRHDSESDDANRICDNSVWDTIVKALQQRGILELDEVISLPNIKARNDMIIKKLQQHGKYVFLIVDHIDDLYRVSPTDTSSTIARNSLGDLAWLGNQCSGRFGVILCGSSASSPLLITCHANREEFPMLRGAPNLNYQKYPTWRLPSIRLNDFNSFKPYLRCCEMEVIPDSLCRLIAFSTHPKPRNINKLEESISKLEAYSLLRDDNSFEGKFLRNLEVVLKRKNRDIIEMLCDKISGKVILQNVMSQPWEEHLQPLEWNEVLTVWKTTLEEENDTLKSFEDLQHTLYKLFDRDELVFDQIYQGAPLHVYPSRLCQIFQSSELPSIEAIKTCINQELGKREG